MIKGKWLCLHQLFNSLSTPTEFTCGSRCRAFPCGIEWWNKMWIKMLFRRQKRFDTLLPPTLLRKVSHLIWRLFVKQSQLKFNSRSIWVMQDKKMSYSLTLEYMDYFSITKWAEGAAGLSEFCFWLQLKSGSIHCIVDNALSSSDWKIGGVSGQYSRRRRKPTWYDIYIIPCTFLSPFFSKALVQYLKLNDSSLFEFRRRILAHLVRLFNPCFIIF